jgi:sugar O-acyltransferase (sialic acid O-acetyltransferase NeuD family)
VIPLWVLGRGGHARVVIDTARQTGMFDVRGVFDDRVTTGADSVAGLPVLGPITPEALTAHGVDHAVIAIGDARARARIAARLDDIVTWATVVHPRAYVAPGACIGAGTVVFAMAVVQPGTRVGIHAVLNTSCSVDHDNAIDDFVQIGPGVHLGGAVEVSKGAFVGTGASVRPGAKMGSWTTV